MGKAYFFIFLSAILAGLGSYSSVCSDWIVILVALVVFGACFSFCNMDTHPQFFNGCFNWVVCAVLLVLSIGAYAFSLSHPGLLQYKPVGIGMFVAGLDIVLAIITYTS